MASLTQWTWVWVNSRSWWWTGRPGVLQFMGSQRVGHDWATELNCKLPANRGTYFFFPYRYAFISFSCLTAVARTSRELRVVVASISFLMLAICVFSLFLSAFFLEAYHFYQFVFPSKNQLFVIDFPSVSNFIYFCFLVFFLLLPLILFCSF